MSIMNRDDALDLLRSAGIAEEQINEDAILIASIIGTAVIRAFVQRLAKKIIVDMAVDAESANTQ